MNKAKRIMQMITGILLVSGGGWSYLYYVVHIWNFESSLSFTTLLYNYFSTGLGLTMLFVGLVLFTSPYDRRTKTIKERRAITITAIVAGGIGIAAQIWDLAKFISFMSNNGFTFTSEDESSFIIGQLPIFITLIAVIVLSIISLILKHPDNSPEKRRERQQAAIQEEQEKSRQEAQIQYLYTQVSEIREALKAKEQGEAKP